MWHIFLIVLRIIHDYVTYPRIVREGIHLHPLAIILSVLAGEQMAGIPGVFFRSRSLRSAPFSTSTSWNIRKSGFFSGWLEADKVEKREPK